ncbi:hypothetical protein MRB53_029883 [Persea americana]|uniref:Uncharacterized protein n=1 Tax=Persea americana TaxID=3435 RepID=A0ACC2KJR4_PERAE|nr:hypothetical protein MRB53_029883 [Persea americana]
MGWKAAQKLIQNWKILRGDNVMIIRGKDQGETGLIKRVVRSQNRVIVEGNNPKIDYSKQPSSSQATPEFTIPSPQL